MMSVKKETPREGSRCGGKREEREKRKKKKKGGEEGDQSSLSL
jgi:hypothetical protein